MSRQFYGSVLVVLMIFGAIIYQALLGSDTFINGAGASFPYPLYSKWIKVYHSEHPLVKINYQSIGSGGGIRQVIQGTVDFGATDAPMNEHELAKANFKVWHIPTVMGSVVLTYNLPELQERLQITPEILVAIYLGEIKSWDHPRLVALNPELKGNSTYILPIRRSDGSGTTAIFTDYLSKVSPLWKMEVGSGKSLKWPTGLGGKGNEGVTGLVKQNHGAIGYVELTYAEASGLSVAALQNSSGNFVLPTLNSVSKAAEGIEIPEDYRVSLSNSSHHEAYPIAAFTYMLFPENISRSKGKELKKFMDWAMTEGQDVAADLKYAPLPKTLTTRLRKEVEEITIN